eukprot:2775602-Alexandrium_andersonii.AAC.1
MSASLVGSEMCIRDSNTPCPCCPASTVLSLFPSLDSDIGATVNAAEPVSYTHLTLPTICSV